MSNSYKSDRERLENALDKRFQNEPKYWESINKWLKLERENAYAKPDTQH